ncbi:MAG: chromosome segregation protein SMC, partial [Mariprofundaceae bacterium]|nr:chromosome segregation protein SMC [Mariprofundaceae bacterium]
MRLKQLDISGFKSFVDPTRITLDEGMTAIVGPNGCGKSNIVDAIRWVLGEHSARQLRGGVMEDLIFQGSDTRAPVGICDVELTFTVQKGKLSPPYHEMEDIRIRRRLVRDVGSDAYINGKPVRLRDIVDIFLDTGVSTRAYAIVEQGSIARMITAKPEERRQLLEEAAGVMKYRARRKEAEQKMKSTQNNMERILDLLEEVRKQCQNLKQQAARAERFKSMQDEHESLSHKALALRFLHQQRALDDLKTKWDVANQAVEEQLHIHQQSELKVAQLRRSLVMHDDEVQQAQDELRQRDQQLSELQRQAERLSGEKRLLEERQHVLEERISESISRQQLLQADVKEVEAQLSAQRDDDLQEHCQMCLAAVEAAQEHVQDAREQRDATLRHYEQLKAQHQATMQQHVQLEKQRQRLDVQTEALKRQQASLHMQHDEHQQQYEQAQAQYQQAEMEHAECVFSLDAGEEQVQQSLEMQRQASQARNQAEQRLRQIRGEMQELQAQLAQQGMSEDIRMLLREKGGVWVDEILSHVPESLELAVAAALRGQEGDVLLPDERTWQASLLISEQWQHIPIAVHQGESRTLNVESPHTLANLLALTVDDALYVLFSQVLVCDDIHTAVRPKHGCVVSRDGWYVSADGWLIPPLKNQTARRLSLQRRLHVGEAAYTKAEQTLIQAEDYLRDIEARLSMYQQQNQQCKQAMQQHEHQMQSAQAWLKRLQDDADSWAKREQQWQTDAQSLAQDESDWKAQEKELQGIDVAQLDTVKQQLDMQNMAQSQYEQQWQQARAALSHAEQALALYQQSKTSLERDMKRMQRELAQLTLRQEQDAQQMAQTLEKLSHNPQHEALDMQLLAAQETADFGHQAMQQLRQQGSELQEALRIQERQEHDANKQLQDVGQARQRIEIAQASETARLQDISLELAQQNIVIENILDDDWQHMDLIDILKQCESLEQRLQRFGAVNLLAIDEFQEASEREQFLSEQLADLESSINTLQDTIVRIDRTTRQRFKDVFEQTNAHFKQIFPQLFGGGRAELRLD